MSDNAKYVEHLKEKMRISINYLQQSGKTNKKFTKSSYETLAKAINEELKPIKSRDIVRLGKTISWEIIRQIMRYGYEVKEPIPPKVYKTLSKICVYHGFKDWIEFKQMYDNNSSPDKENATKEGIKRNLKEAIKFLNEIYSEKKLPEKSKTRRYFSNAISNQILEDLEGFLTESQGGSFAIPTLKVDLIQVLDFTPIFADLSVREYREAKEIDIRKNFKRTEETYSINMAFYTMIKENRRWKVYERELALSAPISPLFEKKTFTYVNFQKLKKR